MPTRLARLCSGRLHYAWVVLAVMFTATLAGVGVRAAPGVMIVPMEQAFGWDVSTISGAISLNIILLGATGPFLTGLMQVIGLKRTIMLLLAVLMVGTGLSTFMTAPWQLFLTWGLMVGIGSGAGAVGMAAAIANRWFARRTGFAMGLLTAANAAGQLIFLPLLALLAERYGWRGVAVCVTLAVAVVLPVVAIMLPESPARIGLAPYGGTAIQASGADHATGSNPFAVAINALIRGARSLDFWLLCLTFGICGFSTNGLINTHLIAYCADHGIAAVNGASILAVIGVFSLIGSTLSGWMCDRFNPRILLFWYYHGGICRRGRATAVGPVVPKRLCYPRNIGEQATVAAYASPSRPPDGPAGRDNPGSARSHSARCCKDRCPAPREWRPGAPARPRRRE